MVAAELQVGLGNEDKHMIYIKQVGRARAKFGVSRVDAFHYITPKPAFNSLARSSMSI